MIIIEDTRQQAGKHKKKHQWWDENNVELLRCKLPFGDYSLPPKVVVDTKANLTEIATNMCGAFKEQHRFKEECTRARDSGCKLVFLIETKNEQIFGANIRLGNGRFIKGEQLITAMSTMHERYGCDFVLVKPENAAEKVIEILENGNEQE